MIYLPAQRCCHYLNAATNAQHRYLAMEGLANKEQLWLIALRTYAMQLRQRLFTQKERIDVATAGEENAVEGVE